MKDIEKAMEERRRQREEELQRFFDKCASKINDGRQIYHLLALRLCERFHIDYTFEIPIVVFDLLDYYVEEVDEDFEGWINKEDAPLIREASQLLRIFPEIACITENHYRIVEIANKIYGLDLRLCKEEFGEGYVYSYSFDFNSFKPIDMNRIKELKTEISFCEKYDVDYTDLKKELDAFGLSDEYLELI